MNVTAHRTPNETFAGFTDLVVEVCCSCGVMFAFPSQLQCKAREDSQRWFYCPNGHAQHYGGRSLRRQLKDAEDREAAQRAYREQAEASARAQGAAATRARNERDRVRKRVAHGVCPCCKRTFKQLGAHMERKHPEFVRESSS